MFLHSLPFFLFFPSAPHQPLRVQKTNNPKKIFLKNSVQSFLTFVAGVPDLRKRKKKGGGGGEGRLIARGWRIHIFYVNRVRYLIEPVHKVSSLQAPALHT